MDKTSHHFGQSVFKDKGDWWDSVNSWKLKYVDGDSTKGRIKWYFGLDKPVQLTDAWHFFKMLMIVFICTSISLLILNPVLIVRLTDGWLDYVFNFVGQLVIMGIVWNNTFTLFYHTIWVKKT
jgi:hypothetical protein